MALQDSIPISTLERAISTDVVTAEDLINRALSEQVRAFLDRRWKVGDAFASPTITQRTHVASGLAIRQSAGNTILVSIGMLAQNVPANLPDVPAPSSFDSSYRFGLSLAEEDVGDAWATWHGTDCWWLLEARVVRMTTLSEVRDIFNPALGTFAAGSDIDKRYESQIEFQWTRDLVAPSTTLPAGTAGWAPIGFVFRWAIYAAIIDASVGQLSIQVEDIAGHETTQGKAVRHSLRFRQANDSDTLGVQIVASGTSYKFNLDAEVQGLRVWARTEDTHVFDLKNNYIEEAASVAALNVNGTWGYIYLAPGTDRMPSNAYGTVGVAVMHRGMIIVSRTPPDDDGLNSAALTAPLPFGDVIPAGGAVHVGYVHSGGAVGHYYVNVSAGGIGRTFPREINNGNFTLTLANEFVGPAGPVAGPPYTANYNLAVLGGGGTEDIPFGAHSVQLLLEHTAIDPTATAVAIEPSCTMTPLAGGGDQVNPLVQPRLALPTDVFASREFSIYPRRGNLEMQVNTAFRNNAMADSAAHAYGGNNVYRLAMIGFKF